MLQVKLDRSGHLSSSREQARASQMEQRQEADMEFQGRTPRIRKQGIFFFFLVPSSSPNLLCSSSVLFLLLGMGHIPSNQHLLLRGACVYIYTPIKWLFDS